MDSKIARAHQDSPPRTRPEPLRAPSPTSRTDLPVLHNERHLSESLIHSPPWTGTQRVRCHGGRSFSPTPTILHVPRPLPHWVPVAIVAALLTAGAAAILWVTYAMAFAIWLSAHPHYDNALWG